MGADPQRLKEILAEAVARATPEARAAYLDATCGDDAGLRAEVEGLLEAHTRMGDFLEESVISAADCPVGEKPGDVIGHYKLLEQIGEGGFGVVFMAEQLEPIRRRVALKIVKPGMDTKQVIVRFEAERQALAMMTHPNIAQVFDAGATDSGRPFFVMELVHGVPITHYCDANDLPPAERLKLFLSVCAAVEHAHDKGIIHRDLKPSNVLVTLHDGTPVPKVIDFGTAKALHQPLTDKTMFTAFGRLIGTPVYMSPEQAEMSGLEVDRRADIYSLGVLLYELLTGTTPVEAEQLRAAAFDEMMRIIRQEDPPKPSTRVSTLGERATEVAKHRQVDPALLQRTLRGDLDWIVMKALEKDRARRYETAMTLGEDLQRHLGHHPVMAGPPGATYRIRKFVQRHQAGVVSATAAVVVAALFVCQQGREPSGSAPEVVTDTAQARTGQQLIRGVANVEAEAALSPDETMLAYVDYDGPDWDLWVCDLATGERRNLTQSEKYNPEVLEMCSGVFIWSPDSKALAYAWADKQMTPSLRVIDVSDPRPRALHTMTNKTYYVPEAWTQDGRQVLCRRDRPDGMALVSVDTGEIRALPVDQVLDHPRMSADNRFVVFSSSNHVHLLAIETGRRTPLTFGGHNSTPIWAPDDPVVLFSSDRLGSWDLWGVRVEAGQLDSEPFPVRYGIGSFDKRLTTSSKLIVHRDVPAGDGYTIAEGAPSADVSALEPFPGAIYVSIRDRLYRLTSEAGQAVVRPVRAEGQPSKALHAGQRWFLQTREAPAPDTSAGEPRRGLFAVTPGGADERAVDLTGDLPLTSIGECRWAMDYKRQLADGRISWIVRDPGAPDAGTPPAGIYSAQVAFDDAGRITGLVDWPAEALVPHGRNHDWSPDGTQVVYTAGPGDVPELHILDLRTLQSRRLTEGSTPVWSPDGSCIAFRRGHNTILTIQPDGAGLQTVAQRAERPGAEETVPRPGYYELIWSPDSSALLYGFFSWGASAREVYGITRTGGEPFLLTRSIFDDAVPIAWLPEREE